MKVGLICALLAAAAVGWASEAGDRAAIEQVVAALSGARGDAAKAARLFTPEGQRDVGWLPDLDARMAPGADEPWSEVTRPGLAVETVRFLTPDVALVDAASVQFGSPGLAIRVPLLPVMQKEAAGWKIASLRLLARRPEPR